MVKWHLYENSDELVIAKKRRAQVMVCVPLNYDSDYSGQDGKMVEYNRRLDLAKKVLEALNKQEK